MQQTIEVESKLCSFTDHDKRRQQATEEKTCPSDEEKKQENSNKNEAKKKREKRAKKFRTSRKQDLIFSVWWTSIKMKWHEQRPTNERDGIGEEEKKQKKTSRTKRKKCSVHRHKHNDRETTRVRRQEIELDCTRIQTRDDDGDDPDTLMCTATATAIAVLSNPFYIIKVIAHLWEYQRHWRRPSMSFGSFARKSILFFCRLLSPIDRCRRRFVSSCTPVLFLVSFFHETFLNRASPFHGQWKCDTIACLHSRAHSIAHCKHFLSPHVFLFFFFFNKFLSILFIQLPIRLAVNFHTDPLALITSTDLANTIGAIKIDASKNCCRLTCKATIDGIRRNRK